MDGYKHYIRIDANAHVIHAFSSAFETLQTGDVCVDEEGGRHFNLDLFVNGVPRYKYANAAMVERSQAEIDADFAALPPTPKSDIELLREQCDDLTLSLADIYATGGVV